MSIQKYRMLTRTTPFGTGYMAVKCPNGTWVPGDVAGELLDALERIMNCTQSDLAEYCREVDSIACEAIAKAKS